MSKEVFLRIVKEAEEFLEKFDLKKEVDALLNSAEVTEKILQGYERFKKKLKICADSYPKLGDLREQFFSNFCDENEREEFVDDVVNNYTIRLGANLEKLPDGVRNAAIHSIKMFIAEQSEEAINDVEMVIENVIKDSVDAFETTLNLVTDQKLIPFRMETVFPKGFGIMFSQEEFREFIEEQGEHGN